MSKERKIQLLESVLKESWNPFQNVTKGVSSKSNKVEYFDGGKFKKNFKTFITFFKNGLTNNKVKTSFEIYDTKEKKINKHTSINSLGTDILNLIKDGKALSMLSFTLVFKDEDDKWFENKVSLESYVNDKVYFDPIYVYNEIKKIMQQNNIKFVIFKHLKLAAKFNEKAVHKTDTKLSQKKIMDEIKSLLANWDKTSIMSDDPRKIKQQDYRRDRVNELIKMLPPMEKRKAEQLLKKVQ